MLPELRATLFGTNPNRKHIDWKVRACAAERYYVHY